MSLCLTPNVGEPRAQPFIPSCSAKERHKPSLNRKLRPYPPAHRDISESALAFIQFLLTFHIPPGRTLRCLWLQSTARTADLASPVWISRCPLLGWLPQLPAGLLTLRAYSQNSRTRIQAITLLYSFT